MAGRHSQSGVEKEDVPLPFEEQHGHENGKYGFYEVAGQYQSACLKTKLAHHIRHAGVAGSHFEYISARLFPDNQVGCQDIPERISYQKTQ